MRIAYLTSQYPATSHTFIRREVEALRSLGVAVDTFSIRAPSAAELGGAAELRAADGTFTVLCQPLTAFAGAHLRALFGSPGRFMSTLALAWRHRAPGLRAALLSLAHFGEAVLLAGELRRRGVGHLHNHFANSGATVGLLASHFARIPWSFTIHGISEFDYPAGLTLAAKIERANFVAAVSYFGRAQASRMIDAALWRKLNIVRCGLALGELPKPAKAKGGPVQLITVGRLSAEKGFSGLLNALTNLVGGGEWHLTMVGDGPLGDDLKREAAALGLTDCITFAGRLAEQETLAAVAQADALVLPSFMEGLPVVLMEALALGKPVIASRVAGIPELVEEGVTGLLFAPSNWDELRTCLEKLIADPELRARMGRNGPPRIAEEFDVRLSAERLRTLFGLDDRSAPTPMERHDEAGRGKAEASTTGTTAAESARLD